MLHAPIEESPRISAIRVMHFSIAPSIPIEGGRGGGGKAERKRDRVLENQRDRTTTRDDEYRTVEIAYISRVRADPPAVHPKPSRACTRVYVCVCLHPPFPAARRRHKVRIALAR